ncbi:MAG: hypothetical protein OIN88_07020 [Candidatus Methanoperedens sp.]|nr:hypothetical protein [Candidatus Methanoperedens sp.]MCZ7359899.1 hypothetical protein [Candidatus Methanoperedens sp.]HLB71761.1 hypothetical protein [Candidatus Methanoperedens sp.]
MGSNKLNEFYNEEKDEHLFRERALKEAVHELGHTFMRKLINSSVK